MLSVIIPTYKRVNDLSRCLPAILNQSRKPDEVILVVRESDKETLLFLKEHYPNQPNLRTVHVVNPGQVAALNAGLDSATGDIIAITDDDTVPRLNWLSQIENHFQADPRLGGLGGRDWVHHHGRIENGTRKVVGKVQWFGRVIGNHHLGTGAVREVDLLKGANMSYRRSAIERIRFQTCLKGSGAQVHNDLDFSMAVKKAGWSLKYDPNLAIDHYPADRSDMDRRNSYNPQTIINSVHNETYVLLKNIRGFKRILYLIWILSVGSSSSPGFIQWIRLLLTRGLEANTIWYATICGRRAGVRTWRKLHKEELP